MEIIAALEDGPRGIYCGTIGLLKPGGDAMFNVAIRTVALDTLTGSGLRCRWRHYRGFGRDEYDEILAKSRILRSGC